MLNVTGVERLLPAGGAALITLAVLLAQIRMDASWAAVPLLLMVLVPAGAVLAFAVAPGRSEVPGQAALLAVGLALAAVAIVRLFEVLGSDDPLGGGAVTTLAIALFAALAGVLTVRTGSVLCLLVTFLAVGGTFLAGVDWLVSPDDIEAYRVTLVVLTVIYAIVAARAAPGRERDIMVGAAGVAVLGLAALAGVTLVFGFGTPVPWGWEAVQLVAGLGLGAYAVLARAPGPGLQSAIALAVFVFVAAFADGGEDTGDLVGWPLALLVIGVGALVAGAVLPSRATSDR